MTRYPALAPLHPAIPAADGLILRGQLVYPHGNTGSKYPLAVMAPQYPSTMDSYAPLAADLHALGVATLAFDLRGHGKSIWTASGAKVAPTPAEPTMEAFGESFMGSASAVGFSHIADDIVRVTAWGMAQNFIDTASDRSASVRTDAGGAPVTVDQRDPHVRGGGSARALGRRPAPHRRKLPGREDPHAVDVVREGPVRRRRSHPGVGQGPQARGLENRPRV